MVFIRVLVTHCRIFKLRGASKYRRHIGACAESEHVRGGNLVNRMQSACSLLGGLHTRTLTVIIYYFIYNQAT